MILPFSVVGATVSYGCKNNFIYYKFERYILQLEKCTRREKNEMLELKVGERWPRVEVLKAERIETKEVTEDQNGNLYETGSFYSNLVYDLKCDCGKEFRVDHDDFRGKRKVKDCGCGIGNEDMIVFIGLSLPMRVRKLLTDYADEQEMKHSHAAIKVIEQGVAALRREDAQCQ